MKLYRIYLAFLIVAVLALVAPISLALAAPPSYTQYIDLRFGFSVTAPAGWEKVDQSADEKTHVIWRGERSNDGTRPIVMVLCIPAGNSTDQDIVESYKNGLDNLKDWETAVIDVAGMPAMSMMALQVAPQGPPIATFGFVLVNDDIAYLLVAAASAETITSKKYDAEFSTYLDSLVIPQ